MQISVPKIGSRVRVTTVYCPSQEYKNKFDNFVSYVREGIVVKSSFDDPFRFALETADVDRPIIEFSVKSQHLVGIEVVEHTDRKAWRVAGNGADVFFVTRANGVYSCTCDGFKHHGACDHIRSVVDGLSPTAG